MASVNIKFRKHCSVGKCKSSNYEGEIIYLMLKKRKRRIDLLYQYFLLKSSFVLPNIVVKCMTYDVHVKVLIMIVNRVNLG